MQLYNFSNPEVRNEDGTRHLQRADIETVRQTDGWMDGWMDGMDGWMFFKILVPRLHVPAGAFSLRKNIS